VLGRGGVDGKGGDDVCVIMNDLTDFGSKAINDLAVACVSIPTNESQLRKSIDLKIDVVEVYVSTND